MSPKISILMANYNKSIYIAEAISSVINQTFKDWELIIIDDSSTDNSVEIIKKFLFDKRILFFINENNIGKTKTLKKLSLKSNSEIIGILDSDDAIASNALFEIVNAYHNNPEYGYIYTQCYYCNENLKPLHLGFSAKIPEGKSNLHSNSVVAMRTYKKEALLKTEGYDEKVIFAEDIDIALKIEEVTNFFFLNIPLYYYRILSHSQSHGLRNTLINRSSTALAKLNAYKRRINTKILNLNKAEISEVLFWGMFTSLLANRHSLFKKFIFEIFTIYPIFFIDLRFYFLIFKKIKKILLIKLR